MAQKMKNQVQKGTAAVLNNNTMDLMQLIRYNSWSGSFTSLPNTITSYDGVACIDHVNGKHGSKAAVVYAIASADRTPYAVVLAWDTPANFNPSTSPNKVLGLCGPRAVIEGLSWESIGNRLDRAGFCVAINDKESKICGHGIMTNNPTNNMANLLTTFQLR